MWACGERERKEECEERERTYGVAMAMHVCLLRIEGATNEFQEKKTSLSRGKYGNNKGDEDEVHEEVASHHSHSHQPGPEHVSNVSRAFVWKGSIVGALSPWRW